MKPLRSNQPEWSILNPDKRYVPSWRTDVAETHKREQQRLQREALPDPLEDEEDRRGTA